MQQLSVLIKPSSSKCNMACSYCFYEDIANHREIKDYGFMTQKTMIKIIDQSLLLVPMGHIHFSFQGGEPTLIGLPFFKSFIDYVEQHKNQSQIIHYNIQTNGTLLNEAWLLFLNKHQFLVGLSLDGDKEHHDTYRYFKNHQSSFDQVLEQYHKLIAYDIDVNILTVVNHELADNIEKVYAFYKDEKMTHLQFLPELSEINLIYTSPHLSEEKYEKMIKTLFDLWYDDIRNHELVSIKYFDQILLMYLGYEPDSCEMKGMCSIQNVIESDGSVYPCDFYVDEKHKLGMIDEGFHALMFNDVSKKFINESMDKHEDCYTCPWFSLCRTGCKRRRNLSHKDVFCKANQHFFTYAHERFLSLAKDIEQGLIIEKK